MLKQDIKNVRRDLGWSQRRLARAMGVRECTISQWEITKISPRYSTMVRLASVLGIDVQDLYKEEKS